MGQPLHPLQDCPPSQRLCPRKRPPPPPMYSRLCGSAFSGPLEWDRQDCPPGPPVWEPVSGYPSFSRLIVLHGVHSLSAGHLENVLHPHGLPSPPGPISMSGCHRLPTSSPHALPAAILSRWQPAQLSTEAARGGPSVPTGPLCRDGGCTSGGLSAGETGDVLSVGPAPGTATELDIVQALQSGGPGLLRAGHPSPRPRSGTTASVPTGGPLLPTQETLDFLRQERRS